MVQENLGENVVGALGFESSNVKPCCALDFGDLVF